jgi:hypothetical protein
MSLHGWLRQSLQHSSAAHSTWLCQDDMSRLFMLLQQLPTKPPSKSAGPACHCCCCCCCCFHHAGLTVHSCSCWLMTSAMRCCSWAQCMTHHSSLLPIAIGDVDSAPCCSSKAVTVFLQPQEMEFSGHTAACHARSSLQQLPVTVVVP